ncbi:MAG TPA: phosphoribosyl-AMP cyclohydrolase [Brevefilum sp.]
MKPINQENPKITYNSQGLVPAIVQNATTKKVLMMAWMNEAAFHLTQATGQAHFWSRSRGELWRKGATSGNTLSVKEILIDCDGDTLLLMVDPAGPACHTGNESCFYRSMEDENV